MPHPENHTNQRQSSNFPSQQTNLAKHGFAMVSPNSQTPKMVQNSHGSAPFPKQNDPKNPTAVYPSESTPGNQTWEFLPWRKQRPARASSTASYSGIQVGFIQRVRKSD